MRKFYIFDLDGTLCTSMKFWRKECAVISSAAVKPDWDGWEDIFDKMREHYRNEVKPKAGVVGFLENCRSRGIKMCIATATRRDVCAPFLEQSGIGDFMDFFLDCYEAGEFKESPKIYLDCAKRFNAEISDCKVFEDSPRSAMTAKTAGFYVAGVYDEITIHDGNIFPWIDEFIRDWEKVKIDER